VTASIIPLAPPDAPSCEAPPALGKRDGYGLSQ
jgi:hypothetical protein